MQEDEERALTAALSRFVTRAFERQIAQLRREIDELRQSLAMFDGSLPRILSVQQACDELGVGRTTFYELLSSGSGLDEAVVRVPGVRGTRLDRDRLMAWIDRLPSGSVRRHHRRAR
ncbi:MAG: helix-turn-helix domain-containing protein [Planctomycetota bacterium]|nr:helix-turn-helix domain-containing protein [Planctomycetota bacterium]